MGTKVHFYRKTGGGGLAYEGFGRMHTAYRGELWSVEYLIFHIFW